MLKLPTNRQARALRVVTRSAVYHCPTAKRQRWYTARPIAVYVTALPGEVMEQLLHHGWVAQAALPDGITYAVWITIDGAIALARYDLTVKGDAD